VTLPPIYQIFSSGGLARAGAGFAGGAFEDEAVFGALYLVATGDHAKNIIAGNTNGFAV